MLNFVCRSSTKPPFAFGAVGEPASILAKGGFLYLKIFILTSTAGEFLSLKLQQKSGATLIGSRRFEITRMNHCYTKVKPSTGTQGHKPLNICCVLLRITSYPSTHMLRLVHQNLYSFSAISLTSAGSSLSSQEMENTTLISARSFRSFTFFRKSANSAKSLPPTFNVESIKISVTS